MNQWNYKLYSFSKKFFFSLRPVIRHSNKYEDLLTYSINTYWVPAICQILFETLGLQRWIRSQGTDLRKLLFQWEKENDKWVNQQQFLKNQVAASVTRKIQWNNIKVTGGSEEEHSFRWTSQKKHPKGGIWFNIDDE